MWPKAKASVPLSYGLGVASHLLWLGGTNDTSELKTSSLVLTLPDAWHSWVTTRTAWPGVSE